MCLDAGVRPVPRSAGVAFLATGLLVLVAPFERLQPLISLPGQKITTVESAILVAAAGWLIALVATGERPEWRTPATWPWLGWLGVFALAAVLAPAFRVNSLKVVGRLAAGFVVVLLTINGVTNPRRLTTILWLAALAGGVVALLATLEAAGAPWVRSALNIFREGIYVVGGHTRASGTLQYPTVASMYFEIIFALTIGLFLAAVDRRATAAVAVLFVLLLLIAEGIIVTLTRAGLVTMAASLVLVGVGRYVRPGWDRGVSGLGTLAAVVAVLMLSSTSLEQVRLRLTTEGQRDWYHADFLVSPALSFSTGSLNAVEATVINKGRVTWEPDAEPPFHVSYHWFDSGMNRVVGYDGVRTPLPRVVPPGDSLQLALAVRAPRQAGEYKIGWDVVQEGRLWFSEEPGSRLALSTVTVTGTDVPAGALPVDRVIPRPAPVVRVGRTQLWRAAARIFLAHPIVGIGPDNFRLSYGPYAGLTDPDRRVTSNNMYLEVLTGAGIIGFVAFAWLGRRVLQTVRRLAGALSGDTRSLYLGIAAGVGAIAVHGLVDSFLTLTPTYLVMSLTVGLAMAPLGWEHRSMETYTAANER